MGDHDDNHLHVLGYNPGSMPSQLRAKTRRLRQPSYSVGLPPSRELAKRLAASEGPSASPRLRALRVAKPKALKPRSDESRTSSLLDLVQGRPGLERRLHELMGLIRDHLAAGGALSENFESGLLALAQSDWAHAFENESVDWILKRLVIAPGDLYPRQSIV